MAVRNFYVSADIDGRATLLEGGPARKDGGVHLKLTQRDEGSIVTALSIASYADGDELVTQVSGHDNKVVYEYRTKR